MATADFEIKAHDTLPQFKVALAVGGTILNLTGATVKFIMTAGTAPGGSIIVASTASIIDAVNGVVAHNWLASETALPGSYLAEWEVTFSSGGKQTGPTSAYNTINIYPDLDNA